MIFLYLIHRIVYNNLTETSKKFLNENTVINPQWLQKLVPDMYKVSEFDRYGIDVDDLNCILDFDF